MVKGFPFLYILFHYRTNRKAVAPVAAAQRIDDRTMEAQVVTVGSAVRESRPRVAVSAHSEQRPCVRITAAGGREESKLRALYDPFEF